MPSGHIKELLRNHTLHKFDSELYHLHSQIVQMAGLTIYQLNQAIQALNEGNREIADNVIARDCEIDAYQIHLDSQVVKVLGRECPVANDLRIVLLTSKIGFELERVGNEIADFGRLVAKLFNPDTSDPNFSLLIDVIKIGNLLDVMLTKIMNIIKNMDDTEAYNLLDYVQECRDECRQAIGHQLAYVVQDARMMGRALDIIKMVKILETCGEHCRDIAQYVIYVIEEEIVRQSQDDSVSLT